jgi:mercuric ion binding protein
MNRVNKIIVYMITSIGLIVSVASAQEIATLQVSGVVCSFCAQGIQKRFKQTGIVKSVNVDLDKHEVSLEFIENKTLTDAEISSLLESAGYNLLKVERSNKLTDQKEIIQ